MRHVVPVDFSTFPATFHSRRLAWDDTGIESCWVLCSRVPPGDNGPKLHAHPSDQMYYIVSGSMNFQLGTDVFTLNAGDFVLIPAGTPHCNWNTTDADEIHLELITPAPPRDRVVIPTEPRTIPDAASYIRRAHEGTWRTVHDGFRLKPLAQRSMGSNNGRVYYAELAPDSGGPKMHFHDFDQFYFILEGTLDIQVGHRRMQAGKNSLVVLPAGTLHTNFNAGPGMERHIAILVPEPPEGQRLDFLVQEVGAI